VTYNKKELGIRDFTLRVHQETFTGQELNVACKLQSRGSTWQVAMCKNTKKMVLLHIRLSWRWFVL